MALYTVFRQGDEELGEDKNSWFPTLTTHHQKNMLREEMYFLKRGIAVKVIMKKK